MFDIFKGKCNLSSKTETTVNPTSKQASGLFRGPDKICAQDLGFERCLRPTELATRRPKATIPD
jgi:hypothetical protein